MTYVAPAFRAEAFHCPFCATFAHMQWVTLYSQERGQTFYYEAYCSRCKKPNIWRVIEFDQTSYGRRDNQAEMTYPDFGNSPLPDEDMPKNVRKDYEEAARIFNKSPRGAAALLRLGLQKLSKHLGEEGNNINTDIRNLASKSILPPLVVKVADTVRITGNCAVHPGEMSEDDLDHVASKMFELLNFIVKKGISEPKELEALYEKTPQNPRSEAERKDAAAKKANT